MAKRLRRPRPPARPSAVALLYEEGALPAPLVVAAGEGRLAEEIIAAARTHGVPVREDPWLVAALLHVHPGSFVPPEMYQAIAELLAFLYTLDSEAGSTATEVSLTPVGDRLPDVSALRGGPKGAGGPQPKDL